MSGKLLFKNKWYTDQTVSTLLINCTKEIINKYARDKTLMLWSEHMKDSSLELLLKSDLDIVVDMHSHDVRNDKFKQLYIVHKNPESLLKLNLFLSHVPRGSYFIVHWPKSTTSRWMVKMLDYFYQNSILNVIGLLPYSRSSVQIYTYFPYTKEECGSGRQVVKVDEYTLAGFRTNFNLFSGVERLKNLHGCSINTFGVTQAPECFMVPAANNTWQVKGNIVHYLDTFQQKYNITYNHLNIYNDTVGWFFFNSSVQDYEEKLLKNNAQLGFGNFYFLSSLYLRRFLHYSSAFNPECITFAVPLFSGPRRYIFTVYLIGFSNNLWLSIVVVLFFSVCLVIIAQKIEGKQDTVISIVLWMSVSLFDGCERLKSKLISMKIFFLIWSLCVLVICRSYESALGSYMTLTAPPEDMKFYKELMRKNFRIVGPRNMYELMEGVKVNEKEMEHFLENFKVLPPGVSENIFTKIHNERNMAAFFPYRYSKFFSKLVAGKLAIPHKQAVYVIPDCFITTVSTPFVAVRGSMIYNILDVFSQQIFESGLNDYWRKKDEILNVKPPKLLHPLRMDKIVGVLVIYFCGIGLATAVFFSELVKGKLDQKKQMRN